MFKLKLRSMIFMLKPVYTLNIFKPSIVLVLTPWYAPEAAGFAGDFCGLHGKLSHGDVPDLFSRCCGWLHQKATWTKEKSQCLEFLGWLWPINHRMAFKGWKQPCWRSWRVPRKCLGPKLCQTKWLGDLVFLLCNTVQLNHVSFGFKWHDT